MHSTLLALSTLSTLIGLVSHVLIACLSTYVVLCGVLQAGFVCFGFGEWIFVLPKMTATCNGNTLRIQYVIEKNENTNGHRDLNLGGYL